MNFKKHSYYTITQGALADKTRQALRVSKNGEFAWFWNIDHEVRVHTSQVADVESPAWGNIGTTRMVCNNTFLASALKKEKSMQETLEENNLTWETKSVLEIEETRRAASDLINMQDMRRIRETKNRVKRRRAALALELQELEEMTGEHAPPISERWKAFGMGIAVSIAAVATSLAIIQFIL